MRTLIDHLVKSGLHVFAETGIPAGPSVIVKPRVSYGDYFGSGLTEVPAGVPLLAPAKDLLGSYDHCQCHVGHPVQ